MSPINKLVIGVVISLLISVFIIVKTYRSGLRSDLKSMLYVLGIFMPIIGLLVYFVYSRKDSHKRLKTDVIA